MKGKSLFEEKQKFTWIWLLMLMPTLLILVLSISEYQKDKDIWALVLPLAILLVTLVFLSSITLITNIYAEGIGIRFIPFVWKEKWIPFSQLKQVYVRKYNALGEYWGYGFKGTAKNRAYNIKGNMGLQLVFHNDQKLLIGTQQPEKLEQIIERLHNEGYIKQEKLILRTDKF